MEHLSHCPVCGHTNFDFLQTCKDFVATGDDFDLRVCKNCSLVFTNPRPSAAGISKYYQSDRYVSHAGDKKNFSFIYTLYDWVRDFSISRKIALIRKRHKSGRLMDLGCGLGYFLNGINKSGFYNAVGVDISNDAIAFVKDKFGLDVAHENKLDTFEKNSFDIITQWHVLEHVHDLENRMKQLKHLLAAKGTMYIAVPNCASWDAKYYGAFWDGYDVPRHLYHFNQHSFSSLMAKHGFMVIDTRPLLFDGPYISMRSEVHSNHSFSFIRGLFIGGVSTLKALFNKNYSSLLFVVTHAD
jgi:2-polyprenyl-3-methyl-5-hydroxy-6-metoxy-1,4-benzoquinol methylase